MTWRAALGAALAIAAVPILVTRHLPLQDLPQHLLVAQILCRYDDPGTDYCDNYLKDFRLRPYVGFYGLAWLLHPWLPVTASARLGLLLYVVLTPLAVWGYTREVSPGRAPASLVAVGGVYSVLYYLGHVSFLMAVPLVFFGLWALLRFTARPSVASGAAYVAAAVGAFLCHAMGFLVLTVAGAGIALLAPRGRRRAAFVLVAACGLLAVAMVPRSGVRLAWPEVRFVSEKLPYVPRGQPRPYQYLSPFITLLYVPAYVANDATVGDAALWGLPLGALLVGLVATRRRPRGELPRRERVVLPIAALLLLFAVPSSTPDIDIVNMKLPAFLFLGIPALFPARVLDRRTVATLALFALASPAYALATHLRCDAEMRGFDEVVAAVPGGAEVLALPFQPRSRALLWVTPYLHMGCLVQVAKGGIGYGLFTGPQIPVTERPHAIRGLWLLHDQPWLLGARAFPEPPWVLTQGLGGRRSILEGTYRSVRASGAFELWERRRTEPGTGLTE